MRDNTVFVFVELYIGVRLIAIAHLFDDLQYRVVEHCCVDNNQGGQVVVGHAHLAEAVVGEDDTHRVLPREVGDVVVHQFDASAVTDANDII